jgi:hypothetical protein
MSVGVQGLFSGIFSAVVLMLDGAMPKVALQRWVCGTGRVGWAASRIG